LTVDQKLAPLEQDIT